MTSKKASFFGLMGMVLATVAFASVSYASPLLEQHRDRSVRISRHTDAPLIGHVVDTGSAEREKSRPQVRRVSTYRDPFGRGSRCHWETLQQGQGTVVVGQRSYDTSQVRVCD